MISVQKGFSLPSYYSWSYCLRLLFKLPRHLVDGTVKSVWFRQVFGLHRFKLHRHLVDWTVKSVWFRQVFKLINSSVSKGFGLDRFYCN
jgi:hypothetical protein